jgi:hypothetical protein
MKIYEFLGIDNEIIEWWHTCHKQWKWLGVNSSGFRDAMRLTG